MHTADPADDRMTHVLQAAREGDPQAAAELLPLVYSQLKALARLRMARTPSGNTLQPTALVHEAYLRLVGDHEPIWNSRGHFFAAAAEAMRQILVEQARRKGRIKHGGACHRVAMEETQPATKPASEDILSLDEALQRLERDDPRKGQIVKLRYFAGLSREEVAAALGLSVRTVDREWRFIIARLHRDVAGLVRSPEL